MGKVSTRLFCSALAVKAKAVKPIINSRLMDRSVSSGCKTAVKRGQSNKFELPSESRLASFDDAKIQTFYENWSWKKHFF